MFATIMVDILCVLVSPYIDDITGVKTVLSRGAKRDSGSAEAVCSN